MVEHKITQYIATISQRGEWFLELNRVKWNNGEEKLDKIIEDEQMEEKGEKKSNE